MVYQKRSPTAGLYRGKDAQGQAEAAKMPTSQSCSPAPLKEQSPNKEQAAAGK